MLTEAMYFPRTLAVATELAHERRQIVRIAKRLRSEEWIVDGRSWQADVVVYPNGTTVPMTLIGRRALGSH